MRLPIHEPQSRAKCARLALLALRVLSETHNPPSLEVIRLAAHGVKRKDIKMVNMSENSEGMRRRGDLLSLPPDGSDSERLESVTMGLRPAKVHEEPPHPTSSLGHLLPKGEGKTPPALSRGERVSRCIGTGEGLLAGLKPGTTARLYSIRFRRARMGSDILSLILRRLFDVIDHHDFHRTFG
jgi:hypothetical protein